MADTPSGENVLAWTVSNWITVVLMATIFFFLLGLGQKWYASKQAS